MILINKAIKELLDGVVLFLLYFAPNLIRWSKNIFDISIDFSITKKVSNFDSKFTLKR